MASIRRRPNARGDDSYAVLFRESGRQRSETFRGRRAAAEAARFAALVDRIGPQAASEIRSAYRPDDTGRAMPTVADWVRHHIDNLSGVTGGTRSDYRSYVRLSLDQHLLGLLPVDLVTAAHVTRWVNDMSAQGLAGKTIRNRHALLSAAFARAIVDRLRGDNPAKSVAIPTTVTEEMTTLTHGEFAILLAHVPRHWQPLVATLAGTGLRFGEATALQVRDLHLDDTPATLTVARAWKHTDSKARELGPPKTRRGRRTVSLGANLVPQLRPLLQGRRHDAFVFTTTRGRPVRHADFLASVWQVSVTRATLAVDRDGNAVAADRRITKRPRLHDLRHCHASWMLAQGMSLTALQYRLGHESIKTTSDRYVHLMPGYQDQAAVMAEIALAQALPELEG
ncbi:MAG: tyrosine-type recombinase/integrase [Acidimicrobiales bacterium]